MRKKLKLARVRKGLSVIDISRKLGISPSFYYKIESGTRNPTINLAKEIADVLDETVENLFFNDDLDKTSKSTA